MHGCQKGPHENERWGFILCNIIDRLTLVCVYLDDKSITCYRDAICADEKQKCWYASCASLCLIKSTKIPFDYTHALEYLDTAAIFPFGIEPVSFIMNSKIDMRDKILWLNDIAGAGYVDADAARSKLNEICCISSSEAPPHIVDADFPTKSMGDDEKHDVQEGGDKK